MKPMINIAQRQSTKEKQIQLLIEKGYDIYVLRLKKISEYQVTIHGFDDIAVKQYKSPNNQMVQHRLEMRPSSYATFEPNDEGVASAYVPGTKRNIDIIASHFYSNQFVIIEIITALGVVPQSQAAQKIKQRADELGIKPAANNSSYNRHLDQVKEKFKKQNANTLAPASLPGMAEVVEVRKEAPVSDPEPALPEGPAPTSEKEAARMAEEQVCAKYDTLVEFLKKKSPQGWKGTGEYKSVIKPEIEQVTAELVKLIVPAATPEAPEVEKVEVEADSLVE